MHCVRLVYFVLMPTPTFATKLPRRPRRGLLESTVGRDPHQVAHEVRHGSSVPPPPLDRPLRAGPRGFRACVAVFFFFFFPASPVAKFSAASSVAAAHDLYVPMGGLPYA